MIKRAIIGIVFSLCLIISSLAQETPTTDIDYTKADQVNNLKPEDLAAAIAQGKITDFSIINDQNLINALNKNIVLLTTNEKVFSEISSRTQRDPSILNNNGEVKKRWFDKFGINDEGAKIENFDGTNLKTSGAKATNFAVKDFPGAKVLQDGSLVTKEGHAMSGNSKVYVQAGKTVIEGGEVRTETSYSEGGQFKVSIANMEIKKGKLVVELYDKDREKTKQEVFYEGSFNLIKDKDGKFEVSSTDSMGFQRKNQFEVTEIVEQRIGRRIIEKEIKKVVERTATIKGKIIDTDNEYEKKDFIAVGNTDVKFNDGTEINFRSAQKTYYTETNPDFCFDGFSCLINKGGNGKHREILRFEGVAQGDKITVRSPVYHSAIETNNLQGEAVYAALNERGQEKVKTIIGAGGKIKTEGNLQEINAGRVDLFFVKDGKQLRTHFSSTEFQKEDIKKYFTETRKTDSLVTCEIGKCEEAFARNFGKIIGPKGKTPTTTVIVGGDFADTVKSVETHCQLVGCYIISSRDVPSKTSSTNLIVTGHHLPYTDYIWRDPPEAKEGHIPIDMLKFADFPKGDITSITFSACNTVTKDFFGFANKGAYKGVTQLKDNYPGLEVIQGWDGTAPGREILKEAARPEKINPQATAKGNLAQYIFKTSPEPPKFARAGMYYTKDGKNYQPLDLPKIS